MQISGELNEVLKKRKIALLISLLVFVIGILLFWYIYSDSSYPQGGKCISCEYTIQGEVNYEFSDESIFREGDQYYNSSLNITHLPLSEGEGWATYYNVQGDVRNKFKPGDLVLLTTTWRNNLIKDEQIWTAEKFTPPTYAFIGSLMLATAGFLCLFLALVNYKTVYSRLSKLDVFLYGFSVLGLLPGYLYGSTFSDLCFIIFVIPLVLLFLFVNSLTSIYLFESRRIKPWMKPIVATGPPFLFAFFVGCVSGVFLKFKYINWWP